VPLNSVVIEKETEDKLIEFLEALEDDDDVQNVFSNLNFGVK
jgi:transcriptional/translational regulatory protein YebC/TACO1